MRFYGKGIVWDKEKDKPLCQFSRAGDLETNDKRVIKRLVELGYEHEGELPKPEPPKPETEPPKVEDGLDEKTLEELKVIADSEGIEYAANIGAKSLVKKIRGE